MFLEPTCPFSVKAFGKLDNLLSEAGEDRITVKLRLHSQPWHMLLGRDRGLAASTIESGKAAAKSVMAAVAAHPEGFEFDRHRGGSNLDATANDIIRRIERYSGVKVARAFAIPDLDGEVKWHCKYARQNGIHVSATFMIDGLVEADMSSGVLSPIGCRAYARNRHATKLRNGHRIRNGVSCPASSLCGMLSVGSFARLQ